ncbi:MAG: OmpH family outer membrane protein [Bryobacteraceae bacterium]
MKHFVLLLPALMLSIASVAGAQTTAPSKVGIIHIQKAIVESKDGQKAVAELEARAAPKKKEIEQKQAEINALREQLNKMSSVGSEDARQKLMRDIDQSTKEFNRSVEDAQAELDVEQNKIMNEIGGKMLAVLDKYARDNGYAVILDVSGQQSPVLFAANGIDVTQEVVKLYDQNSASGAPAPSKPGGTSATPPGGGTTTTPSGGASTTPPAGGTVAPKPAPQQPGTPAPKPGPVK